MSDTDRPAQDVSGASAPAEAASEPESPRRQLGWVRDSTRGAGRRRVVVSSRMTNALGPPPTPKPARPSRRFWSAANEESKDAEPPRRPDRNGMKPRPVPPVSSVSFPLPEAPDWPRPKAVRAPRKPGPKVQPDLVGMQQLQGKHLGDRYVRVCRLQSDEFERAGPGHLVATDESLEAPGTAGHAYSQTKRALIGAPLSSADAAHQGLSKLKALAVLSSNALSSVAYATEELLRILILAGIGALTYSLNIGAAIVALLIVVGVSYRQTIKAYPQGGGAYIVAKENLGECPALVAGGALLIDYTLTVAVSISAAVAAVISAVPELHSYRVALGVTFIVLVSALNLRGGRESGTIFAVPTYLFIAGILAMIAIGLVRNAMDGFTVHEPAGEAAAVSGSLGLFLILRAFSAGCAALTGVEAISDGVPAVKPPAWKHARTTLSVTIAILAVTFAGITFLAHQYSAMPIAAANPAYETVVSQIARSVLWGESPAYYSLQFATMAILLLAANSAYSGFPRLVSFLARDSYLPRQFTFRGDRLAFSTGVILLAIFSSLVLAIFQGETERLIPLYAVGVFTAFTLSQAGMVMRWWRRREPGWRQGLAINLAGALATGVVAIVIAVTQFTRGAWIVILLIPLLILGMRAIHRHYATSASALATQTPLDPNDILHTVVVPIAAVNRVARQTLAYARSISDNVTAVHITDDEATIEQMRQAWNALGTDIPLVIIESPYRSLVGPLLAYVDEIDRQQPDDTLTVVLPEYMARHWWEQMLHNQMALRIKAALLFRPGTVVTSVPYHLERPHETPPARPPVRLIRH